MACSLATWLKRKPEESVKSDHGTKNNEGENQKKAKYVKRQYIDLVHLIISVIILSSKLT